MGHKGVSTEDRKVEERLYVLQCLRVINAIRVYGRGGELTLTKGEFGDDDHWDALRTQKGRRVAASLESTFAETFAIFDSLGLEPTLNTLRDIDQLTQGTDSVINLLEVLLDSINPQQL